MTMAHRKCTCNKSNCFTCHRRRINERYAATHQRNTTRGEASTKEVSDEELDRRALLMMKRIQDAR